MPNPRERFADRHIGPRSGDIEKMLATIGAATLDEMVAETIPASILDTTLDLPEPMSEQETIGKLRSFASQNTVLTSLIGLGYHDTITPPVIQRNVLESPAWYTAYTPYQPEISQGRLEALLNFQTMVSDLTGLEVANASLLDEATAAAEAMAMCRRLAKGDRPVFYVDDDCHLPTIAVVETRAGAAGVEIRRLSGGFEPELAFGLLLQYPGSSGAIRDHRELVAEARAAGVFVVVATDLLALTLLTPPGEWGADIVVGSAQRFGVPLGYGGPHAGFIATREAHVRALPGRLVGVSHDRSGRVALRLALQTREQHIRREKATSNVCTAQVLLAVIAGFYGCWHGPDGLRDIAGEVHRLTGLVASSLTEAGFELVSETFFDTITVKATGRAQEILALALAGGVNLGMVDEDHLRIALDETTTAGTVNQVLDAFGAKMAAEGGSTRFPEGLIRRTEFMTHPVFSLHQSEHEMLRYLRRLSDRDLALDRSMIPLGSCTMKLNATTEMIPMTWPEFAGIHPYAPDAQAAGYHALIEELSDHLCRITGYDAVSVQPNAGSQGELAGLLAIRAYHRSRGDSDRVICLIPSSAHGTNAASAVMAGMKVVVVATDDSGNVDLVDLEAKASEHADRLAAAMITYPSTHGVFEEGVRDLARIVHTHGGQVYVDGANLNAMVGLARPGDFGADVGHLNLHKTFTIPHGGGGPGVGPIGVKAHLAPFLPNHPLHDRAGPATGVGPVSGAPFGSAGILMIPYSYLCLMGAEGLRTASKVAILSANYLARRLDPYFPVLYSGNTGRVAHESILDLRPLTRATGVTAEDVAKRLADYGFHAPTLSFPVAGTLMVEPTESESLEELDRFCDAMIAIHGEISRVESGEWDRTDNPLRNAPHSAEEVVADHWDHPYTRETAAYPVPSLRVDKYWPPVGRVDGPGGDRNLICACPPLDAYA
ncbi:MAG TPA: aminomethyl-transferring glycine dehydrogenase [Acidimicrobiia bacterium]|nr:aminomethyl-transferring glycine dehydrogenase [Acidimicrobiia bacterium]